MYANAEADDYIARRITELEAELTELRSQLLPVVPDRTALYALLIKAYSLNLSSMTRVNAMMRAMENAGLTVVPLRATEAMVECFPYSYGAGLIEAMQPWERKKLIEAAILEGNILKGSE
jgi:hypothetical protein